MHRRDRNEGQFICGKSKYLLQGGKIQAVSPQIHVLSIPLTPTTHITYLNYIYNIFFIRFTTHITCLQWKYILIHSYFF